MAIARRLPCDAVGSIVAQAGKKLKERLERAYLLVRRGRPLQRPDDFAVPPDSRGARSEVPYTAQPSASGR